MILMVDLGIGAIIQQSGILPNGVDKLNNLVTDGAMWLRCEVGRASDNYFHLLFACTSSVYANILI